MQRFILPVMLLLLLLVSVFVSPLAGSVVLLVFLSAQLYRMRGVFYSKRGFKAFSEGNLSGAVRWYEKSYDRKNPTVKTILSLALLYEKAGDFGKARVLVDRLREREGLSDYERGGLDTTEAVLFWKEGQPEKADRLFRKIGESFKNTSLYGCMGAFYLSRNDRARALAVTEEGYHFNGDNGIIRDNYGRALYGQDKKEEAREIWERLTEENSPLPEPYYNLARHIIREGGDRDRAREFLSRALDLPLSRISYLAGEDLAALKEELDRS